MTTDAPVDTFAPPSPLSRVPEEPVPRGPAPMASFRLSSGPSFRLAPSPPRRSTKIEAAKQAMAQSRAALDRQEALRARRAQRTFRWRNLVGWLVAIGIVGGSVWAWFHFRIEDVGRRPVDRGVVTGNPAQPGG